MVVFRAAATGLLAGLSLWMPQQQQQEAPLQQQAPTLSLLTEVEQSISVRSLRFKSLSETDAREVDLAAARAALKALGDPYAGLVKPRQASAVGRVVAGGFSSSPLGAVAVADSRKPGVLSVIDVDDGGPADIAGLHVGDRIVKRDEDVLTVDRDGRKNGPLRIVVREAEQVKKSSSVPFSCLLPDDVAYLKLADFGPEASADVQDALLALNGQAYILDLRGNPGGLLTSAVDTLSLMLPGETVVARVAGLDDNGVLRERSYTTTSNQVFKGRAAVLVDEETGSAAEVFAAGLRDQGRALLVGSRTLGKGVAQEVIPLLGADEEGKDDALLRLTTASVETAQGPFDKVGLAPDIVSLSTPATPLDSLLVARGAYFDFAAAFSEEHPALVSALEQHEQQPDLFQSALDRDLAKSLHRFLRRPGLAESLLASTTFTMPTELPRSDRAEAAARASALLSLREALREAGPLRHAEDAVRARFQGETARRLAELQRDATLKSALDALRSSSEYDRILTTPRQATASSSTRPTAMLLAPVEGYDPDAECLALQTCDTEEFVYVVPI